jgi:hypothetical protein
MFVLGFFSSKRYMREEMKSMLMRDLVCSPCHMCRWEQLEPQNRLKGPVITYKIRVGFAGSGGSNMSGYINAKENDALNMPNIPSGMPKGQSLGVSSRLGRIPS